MKHLLKLGGTLVKRLIARGDFKTPKLFKRIQLGGLASVGSGVAMLSSKASEVDSEIVELGEQVSQMEDKTMAMILLIGGLVAIIVARLPIQGSMGDNGDPIPPPPPPGGGGPKGNDK